MAPMSVCLKVLQMNFSNRIFYANFFMSGFIKQIMTDFANPDSRKLAGLDVAWVEKRENFKLPTLIFCSFFRNLSRTSKENHLSKKK